jgi:TIR domain-containing protein
MSSTVRAVITAPYALGFAQSFPLVDFGSFLESLTPLRVALTFQRRNARHTVIEVNAEFDENATPASAALFKEVLIRAEPGLDFECAFPPAGAPTMYDEDWAALTVDPEPASLPSGKPVAVALPLLEGVPEIFRHAHLTNCIVAYRLALERHTGSREHARTLVPALAELAMGGCGLAGLDASLNHAASLLRGNGWSAVERICIPRSSRRRDSGWIEALVRKHLRNIATFADDELLPLKWDAPAITFASATLEQRVACLREDDFLSRVIEGIVPSTESSQVLVNCVRQTAGRTREPATGNYAFISYAHRDAAFANALLHELTSANASYWMDDRIDPGSRWDETLEERIRGCGVLIACVSDEYQQSKYCRRELKFADFMNKPILPVAARDCAWQPGLQMMFQELQIATFGKDRGFGHVRRALSTLAPHVFETPPDPPRAAGDLIAAGAGPQSQWT